MPITSTKDGDVDPVCKLPQEVGPCRSMLKRWWYDTSSGRCLEFTYGGCRGNANNFESKGDCEAKCGGGSAVNSAKSESETELDEDDYEETDICHLPHERGSCKSYTYRWGFDASSGKCIQFVYGGCNGNENNFETKEMCEQRCLGELNFSMKQINLFGNQ